MPRLDDAIFERVRGRNGGDPPFMVLRDQAQEMLNVELYRSSLGRKRAGSEAVAMTGTTPSGGINFLGHFEQDDDPGNNELFIVDDDTTPVISRLGGGSTWADLTATDDPTAGDERKIDGVSLNGKFFLAYNSSVNRLHVYDPADGEVRRAGLSTPSGFTSGDVADTGSGSYTATERFYKQAYIVKSGDDVLRRSELTASVSFTPSGTGTAARVTKADTSSPAENETHWELYASIDDVVFYLIAETAVGTTTFDDSTEPEDYDGDLNPLIGTNIPPPSCKYLLADDARLLMAGVWETAAGGGTPPKNNRLWWTPLLGTTNIGDDERVPNISGEVSNYIDMEAPITGIGGPLFGSVYVFSAERAWKLIQTGNALAPYVRVPFASNVGCISHRSIVSAEDEDGNPALYWLSREGPKRVGVRGVVDLVDDIEDIWEDVNLDTDQANFGIFFPARHQIWWWVDTDDDGASDTILVYHTHEGIQDEDQRTRYGWTKYTGGLASAQHAVMFATTFGASMSVDQSPYIAKGSADNEVWRGNVGTQDDGVNYQGLITLPDVAPWGLGRTGGFSYEPYVLAEASSGVTLTLSAIRDFGIETRTGTVSLSASGSETRVRGKVEGLTFHDLETVQLSIGDSAAADTSWNIDAIVLPGMGAGRDGVND